MEQRELMNTICQKPASSRYIVGFHLCSFEGQDLGELESESIPDEVEDVASDQRAIVGGQPQFLE